MKVAVIGTGYVGLVTGTCFAETGNIVTCVDIDIKKVEAMKNGQVPIFEPGLEILFDRNIGKKRLSFTNKMEEAVKDASIVFLCLPTPQGGDGAADLQYILKVADEIGKLYKSEPNIGFKVIVDKSTVPVGTSDKVKEAILNNAPNAQFEVASNPEFLREGMAVEDFMKPERVVIGTANPKAKEILDELYEPFVRSGNPIYYMDVRSAEMTKYASNSFLATKISFMNEIANLCELTGAEVDKVRIGMGSDSRIGKRFLFPGIGYGGSCFPKDVVALINTANENNYDFKILKSVVEINDFQVEHFFQKILAYYNGTISGKHFALWGLAFKPNTDDVREAPAAKLIKKLLQAEASVCAYDPEAVETMKSFYNLPIKYAENAYDALHSADSLLIVTEWNEFRNPDFAKIRETLAEPVIFDGRNLYDLEKMEGLNFNYYSVGRKYIKKSVPKKNIS